MRVISKATLCLRRCRLRYTGGAPADDDAQAPPIGTKARTVLGVDDIGSIMVGMYHGSACQSHMAQTLQGSVSSDE